MMTLVAIQSTANAAKRIPIPAIVGSGALVMAQGYLFGALGGGYTLGREYETCL